VHRGLHGDRARVRAGVRLGPRAGDVDARRGKPPPRRRDRRGGRPSACGPTWPSESRVRMCVRDMCWLRASGCSARSPGPTRSERRRTATTRRPASTRPSASGGRGLNNREPTVRDPAVPLPAPLEGATVALEGVTARYPSNDEPAFRDLDLVLEPGRRVALVGSSGSGKTVTNLLLRFLVDQGEPATRPPGGLRRRARARARAGAARRLGRVPAGRARHARRR
jgi:hypothetical protein